MLFTFKARRRSHPLFSGKLLGECPAGKVTNEGHTRQDASILIERGAPRHAGVVDEDVDLTFLGLNGLDEVVATGL